MFSRHCIYCCDIKKAYMMTGKPHYVNPAPSAVLPAAILDLLLSVNAVNSVLKLLKARLLYKRGAKQTLTKPISIQLAQVVFRIDELT